MKKPLALAALVVLLALSGCAAADDSGDTARVAEGSTAEEPAAPSETPPPDATTVPVQPNEIDDAVEIYMNAMRNGASAGMESTSDAVLIDAGRHACELYAAGTPFADIQVVSVTIPEDEAPGLTNQNIKSIATETFCPEFSDRLPKPDPVS